VRSLSTLLSQVLIAFTIEFDNEFERQIPHRTAWGPAAHSGRGPLLVSMAMWVNFMRFIDPDGTPVVDLTDQIRATNFAGMQRWSYVVLDAGIVRPTRGGLRAAEVWRPMTDAIEARWRDRFDRLGELRSALLPLAGSVDLVLPDFLPKASVYRQERIEWAPGHPPGTDLSALLSRLLLAFTIEFEHGSRVSLALAANVLRVLTEPGVSMRDLPLLTGVSKEAVSVSVKFLERQDHVVIEPHPTISRAKSVRLTPTGLVAQGGAGDRLRLVEEDWRSRFGSDRIDQLCDLLAGIIDAAAPGLVPDPAGWRAHPPYVARTQAMIRDPGAALPHYPMVSHRGGYPDGS
jgi:DNA-binding MarR family transcriptional regulator